MQNRGPSGKKLVQVDPTITKPKVKPKVEPEPIDWMDEKMLNQRKSDEESLGLFSKINKTGK